MNEPRFVVELADVVAGTLKRVPLAMLGAWVKGKHKFAITKATMAEMIANFRARKADTVVDYEHASEFPEAAQGQPIPAAGWLKAIEDAPDKDGVLYGQVEFTPRAAEMIAAKEYKYFSPVINYGARDKGDGKPQGATLESLALTNRPFLDAMPAVALSERGWREEEGGKKAVLVKKLVLADRTACTVRVMAEDGTESVMALEGLAAEPKVVRLSDVKRDKDGKYDFTSLPQDEGTLIASEVLLGMQVQTALDEAVADGKVLPAQRATYEKLALSDLAGFQTLVASMKGQVDLRERGTGGEGLTGLAQVEAAIQAAVADKMTARPMLGYTAALRLVASEKADLFALKGKFQKGGR